MLFASASVVGAIAIIVRWLAWSRPTARLELWVDKCTLAAIGLIAVILLVQVFREGRVTHVRIQGAIAVYLLFGVAWAHCYHIAETLHPGSFAATGGALTDVSDWLYYSFVTLSTVGYGDIVPVRPIARSLAVGEALCGQLYLAVLIARLVAMEVVFWQQQADRSSNSQS